MGDERRGRSWRRRGKREGPAHDGATGLTDADVEVVEVVRIDGETRGGEARDDEARDDDMDDGEPAGAGPLRGSFVSDRSGWPALPAWFQTLLVFVSTAVVVFVVITLLGTSLS